MLLLESWGRVQTVNCCVLCSKWKLEREMINFLRVASSVTGFCFPLQLTAIVFVPRDYVVYVMNSIQEQSTSGIVRKALHGDQGRDLHGKRFAFSDRGTLFKETEPIQCMLGESNVVYPGRSAPRFTQYTHKGMSLRDLGPATVRTRSLAGALASVWAE